LAAAAKIGYAAVELIPEKHWAVAHDNGLVIASHGGHASISSGLNDSSQHGRIRDEIRRNLDLAVRHDVKNLIIFSGERIPGQSDDEGAKVSAEGIAPVAADAEKAGVTLVIELLNSKVDHKGYLCDRTPWAASFIAQVGSPRVKALYDIYHMQIMEGDIIRTIRDYHQIFGHYHTAGNPGRRDLDTDQELYYPPIIRAIAETNYDGYVGHEFIPKADPIAALAAAYKLCDVG
jgi:hydroxypyruvate isomerase